MMPHSHASKATSLQKARAHDGLGSLHEHDWCSALAKLDGAYSQNTIRSYRSDFRIFEAWCSAEGHIALPASPETVATFVKAESEISSPATVSRRRAAITKIHKLLKLGNPVTSEEVNLATRTMYRQKGRRQVQALGLTQILKRQLIAVCPEDLVGARDRALISVGYDTLCRRSELVQLLVEDLNIESDGSGTILVRKSKTDQVGAGRLAYLSAKTLGHLQIWLTKADLNDGPMFRGVQHRQVGKLPLNPSVLPRILKHRAQQAGLSPLEVAGLSGHSMRVGAAQDMASAGIDLGAIMHAGGWKSPDMVMRYIEHMDIQKSGMARLYGRSEKGLSAFPSRGI